MSAISKMSAEAIYGYFIGKATILRKEWMTAARQARTAGKIEDARWCIRSARRRNRELLESLRTLRDSGVLKEEAS